MNKKDRIAVVVSVVYFLFSLAFASKNANPIPIMFLGFIIIAEIPLIIYWGIGSFRMTLAFLKLRMISQYRLITRLLTLYLPHTAAVTGSSGALTLTSP